MSLSSEPYGCVVGIEDMRRQDIANWGETDSSDRGERTAQHQNHRDDRRDVNHSEYICREVDRYLTSGEVDRFLTSGEVGRF